MYQTLYDEAGFSGLGERCAALIERCAPRMMVAGGGGLPGLWREHSPVMSAETKAAIRSEWLDAQPGGSGQAAQRSSRAILEAIAEKHAVHYQTVCKVTRELRGA